jgi:hypothetical protein
MITNWIRSPPLPITRLPLRVIHFPLMMIAVRLETEYVIKKREP